MGKTVSNCHLCVWVWVCVKIIRCMYGTALNVKPIVNCLGEVTETYVWIQLINEYATHGFT